MTVLNKENEMTYELIGVAFLEESKEAAGLPKGKAVVPKAINALGQAKAGSGHDCFLKGITVQLDVTATAYHWMQMMRYHWFDIVSSESKMHCITEMDITARCTGRVSRVVLEASEKHNAWYKTGEIHLEDLLDNLPQGFMLKARVVTNYLQLKTMYAQRKNHRLVVWKEDFVNFCNELPEFLELTQKEPRT